MVTFTPRSGITRPCVTSSAVRDSVAFSPFGQGYLRRSKGKSFGVDLNDLGLVLRMDRRPFKRSKTQKEYN